MPITKSQILKYGPCAEGRVFLKKHKTLKAAWTACNNPDWMIWALSKAGLFDDRLARQFAIACAEHVLHLFERDHPNDKRPRRAIEAAKGFLNGTISANQMAAAQSAAQSAAWAAAQSAAWAAARAAAWATAQDAAQSAAWAAAQDAAQSAAWAAENKWEANELRKLINPFSDESHT